MIRAIRFRPAFRALGLATAVVAAFAVGTAPGAARADHGGPGAASLAELVQRLTLQLDELADGFDFGPRELPSFEDSRFSKLLRKSRRSLDHAIDRVDRGRVCEGLFGLERSVSQLEDAADYGAQRNLSGWGFAEDLASVASFVAESLLEDLIVLLSDQGADPIALGLAIEAEATGGALRDVAEWTAATEQFAAGSCVLI